MNVAWDPPFYAEAFFARSGVVKKYVRRRNIVFAVCIAECRFSVPRQQEPLLTRLKKKYAVGLER